MIKRLLDFLNASPVNFLALKNNASELEKAGCMPRGHFGFRPSIPLRGVDMGNPILAMHSCRETGRVADHIYCVRAFTKFMS